MLCGSSPGVHEKLHDLPEMSRVAFGRRAGRRQDERETGTLAKHLSTLRYAQKLFGRKFGELRVCEPEICGIYVVCI